MWRRNAWPQSAILTGSGNQPPRDIRDLEAMRPPGILAGVADPGSGDRSVVKGIGGCPRGGVGQPGDQGLTSSRR